MKLMLRLPKIITNTLSLRLSLMVVVEIAVLLLVSLAVMFHFSRQALREEAMSDAEQTLEGTIQHVDNILLSVEQSTGNFYRDIITHLDQPERMYDYSRRIVESNPYIIGCAIVFKPDYYPDRKLFMAYVHRKDKIMMTDEESVLVTSETFGNRPYTEQVWYTEPMETGRALWTNPLKDKDTEGEALTTFCLPLYDQNMECVGVLATDLSISLLSQIVLAAKPSPNGYTSLLGRNGSFIVHPDSDKLAHQTVYYQIEHGADRTILEVAESMLAGETGLKSFQRDGKDWYVFFKPFERSAAPGRTMEKLGWSIGVVYPEDDIFGDYNQLLYIVLAIAVIGLILFFVLCRWITHRQLLPLHMLTYSVQRIADGNYDETIPYTRREDEIGQLQDHFQQMQQSLATQISELDQLDSTLQERNEVLKKAYAKAQKADRMKTVFLHNMTNQMIAPSDAIEKSVSALCTHYHDISLKEADDEIQIIKQQSQTIIELINTMIHSAENETEDSTDKQAQLEKKEDAHE